VHAEPREINVFQSPAKATHLIPLTARTDRRMWVYVTSSQVFGGSIVGAMRPDTSPSFSVRRFFVQALPMSIKPSSRLPTFQGGGQTWAQYKRSDQDWGLIDKLIASRKPYSLHGLYQSTRLTCWSWPMKPSHPSRIQSLGDLLRCRARSTKMSRPTCTQHSFSSEYIASPLPT
jgi:hypothetical protein